MPGRASSSSCGNVANLVPPCEPDSDYHGTFRCAGVRRAEPEGQAHRRARPRALRRHPGGAASGGGTADSGRLHRQVDDAARPAADAIAAGGLLTDTERQTALERASIRSSIANLRTFPWVSILERRSGSSCTAPGSTSPAATSGRWTRPLENSPSAVIRQSLEGSESGDRSRRMYGNSNTSRIDAESVSSITRRSMPSPWPPVGGRPYSSARM